MGRYGSRVLRVKAAGYVASVLGVGAVIAALSPFEAHLQTTAALALVIVVLFIASAWGRAPALFAAVLGTLGYNFFFLPPVGTLTIAEPQHWVAFVAFAVTALTAGQLSARARRRAQDAERARAESERLYQELQLAFERASEAEALRKSEQFKTALLDAVTHDLRSPLTSIKASVTSILGMRNGNAAPLSLEEERELLEVVNEETDRLDHFVEHLVDMARIEAGELALRRSWGTAEDIVALASQRAASVSRTHQLAVSVEDELPHVEVDSRALAQVLYLLLENAGKYSPAGSTIQLKAVRDSAAGICFSVEDCGPGIAPELRELVFERFFRVNKTMRAAGRPQGLGMGLSIARGIVQAHGGKIWIEDGEDGRGTRVVFSVPVKEAGAGPMSLGPFGQPGGLAQVK